MSLNKRDLFPLLRGQEELDEEFARGPMPPGGCIITMGLLSFLSILSLIMGVILL